MKTISRFGDSKEDILISDISLMLERACERKYLDIAKINEFLLGGLKAYCGNIADEGLKKSAIYRAVWWIIVTPNMRQSLAYNGKDTSGIYGLDMEKIKRELETYRPALEARYAAMKKINERQAQKRNI